jgi:hypothetical protein
MRVVRSRESSGKVRGSKPGCIRPPSRSGEGATPSCVQVRTVHSSDQAVELTYSLPQDVSLPFYFCESRLFSYTLLSSCGPQHHTPPDSPDPLCSGRPAWSTRRNYLLRPQTLKLQCRLSLLPRLSVLPLRSKLLSPQTNIPPELNFPFKQMYDGPPERHHDVV